MVCAGICAAAPAWALPQGGAVSGGSAQISGGTSGLRVDQHTDRAVIDWKTFDVGIGESVFFSQPAASSAILNRIHDQDPSQILGHLTANGTVALVNPNGMLFGPGSQIDVGSLIATSGNLSNDSFMHGRDLAFNAPGRADASIVNQGTVTVREGGLAAFVAPRVTNGGMIQAKLGQVALAAGETAAVDLYGDGLVSVAMTDHARVARVDQTGGIHAESGAVLLTTAEARQVVDQAINMDGWVDVSSITAGSGTIILHAGDGAANVGGQWHADSAMGQGGKLAVTGEHIRVGAGAILTALGETRGGNITIGGDYLGTGDTPHARTTVIEPGAVIDASATGTGDGGRVIVWSDKRTDFYGLIRAKGGPQGGHGGFVETSSQDLLVAHGLADASSPYGKGGLWLLDPNNITINTTADTNVAGNPNFTTTNDNAVVTVASIQAALNAGTSVSITTGAAGANTQSGDITVASAITKSAGGDAGLTLQARNSIFVNSSITSSSGALDLTLHADTDNSAAGVVAITGATIDTNGGDLTIGGGLDPAANPTRGTAANNDGVVITNSTLTTDAGNISIRGEALDQAGTGQLQGVNLDGTTVQTSTGTMTIEGTGGDGTTNNFGTLLSNNALITSATGSIAVIGTAGQGTTNTNVGLRMNSSTIASTGTGLAAATITLTGIGGDGGTNFAQGVDIRTNSQVTSVDGDITITGTGGDGQALNRGILLLDTSSIQSTGTGANAATITLTGTGGAGTQTNHGVHLNNTAAITSIAGAIQVTGIGGNGSSSNHNGIYLTNGAYIASTGTGASAATIALAGTGGNGTSDNNGITIDDAGSRITTVDGDVTLTGTGASAATNDNNEGIELLDNAALTSTGQANISLTAQKGAGVSVGFATSGGAIAIGGGAAAGNITLTMDDLSLANLDVETDGDIILQPRSAGTTVGVAGGAGTLNLSTSVLGFIDAGDEMIIGRLDGAGALTVNAFTWGSSLHLRSANGGISINGAQDVGADHLTLTSDTDPVVGGGLTGTGILTLQQASVATTMGVTGGAGALNYSAADLTALGAGWTSVRLGSPTATGALTVGANAWDSPVTYRSAAAGSIVITGAQTSGAASDTTFTFSGPTTLGANVSTAAATVGTQDITFSDDVTLTGNSGYTQDLYKNYR